MATLENLTIAATYDRLLALPSGGLNGATLVALTDGNASATISLQVATTKTMIGGSGNKLFFGDEGGEYIYGDTTDLRVYSGADILLMPTGNVGIGTTAPASLLHLSEDSDDTNLFLTMSTNNAGTGDVAIYFQEVSTTKGVCGYDAGNDTVCLVYGTGSSAVTGINIISSGVVGIGAIPSLAHSLEVRGTGVGFFATGVRINVDSSNSTITAASVGSGTDIFYVGNEAITTSSDQRLKTNIVDTKSNGLEVVNKFRVVDFNWDDPSDQCINNRNARGEWTGFLAQEAVEVAPYAVNAPRPEGKEIDTDSPDTWIMDYGQLIPILAKAIQELSAKVTALENA